MDAPPWVILANNEGKAAASLPHSKALRFPELRAKSALECGIASYRLPSGVGRSYRGHR
jgi:hypothetical protein